MILTLVKFYKSIIRGVAFLPLTITVSLGALALFINGYESDKGPLLHLPQYLRIERIETSRALLGSILTAVISLTVFGFSMMMVVVNQAASNYSPKVIENFMSERFNKVTLGVYLGTIVFTILTLMQIDNNGGQSRLPDVAVMTNIAMALISVLLFLSFINNISNSVRINMVIKNIYLSTKKALRDQEDFKPFQLSMDHWPIYPAEQSGYFQFLRVKPLKMLLQEEDLILKVLPHAGTYCTEPTPLFALNRKASSDVLQKIRENFVCYSGEDISDNEFYGFRQLREIAVKALSPGVNDPGVAILCIDYLSDLLGDRARHNKNNVLVDKETNPRIIVNRYDLEDLFNECFVSIKVYGKRDFTIMTSLLSLLYNVSLHDKDRLRQPLLEKHALSVIEDSDASIVNLLERDLMNKAIASLNRSGYFSLPLLNFSGK